MCLCRPGTSENGWMERQSPICVRNRRIRHDMAVRQYWASYTIDEYWNLRASGYDMRQRIRDVAEL